MNFNILKIIKIFNINFEMQFFDIIIDCRGIKVKRGCMSQPMYILNFFFMFSFFFFASN